MVYNYIRLVFWIIVFFVLYFLVVLKYVSKRKNLVAFLCLFLCVVLCALSTLLPVENLFIKFETIEELFAYTYVGDIEDVICGDDTCMVYYSAKKGLFKHCFMMKNGNLYDILTKADIKKVSNHFDVNGSFDAYNVIGTDDYYVFGTLLESENAIELFHGDEKIDVNIKRLPNTNFIYFYVKDLSSDYYICINNNYIYIG